MDIVRLKGGLGNQMFQYALGEALRSRGREVKYSLGFYRKNPTVRPFILDKVFPGLSLDEVEDEIFSEIDDRWKKIKEDENLLEAFKRDTEKRFFYVEEENWKYDANIFETKNCVFVGYWQTEKYFSDIRDKLIDAYKFQNIETKLSDFGKQLNGNCVSVHIRRGDYLDDGGFAVLPKDYYVRAISYIKSIMPETRFVFFSDDTKYVSENFQTEDMIVCVPELFDDYKDWYDMYLMTLCRGNIIANSTFSWWGAWLNQNPDKIVVMPEKWVDSNEASDLQCDKWIRV